MPEANTQQLISFLSEVPFFSEVSSQSLEHLCNHLTQETLVTNQTVFNKNDIGDSMYVIFEGSVRVHENDHVFGCLKRGDCFGEYALIDNDTRSASVSAEERTIVLRIDRSHFLDLMKNDSGFAQGILAVMIKRHRELDTIQEHLATSKHDLEIASSKMNGLIQGAMDAIIMFDTNYRIVLTNPSANKLLENNDVLQRNVLFFFDEESANIIENLVKTGSDKELNKYLPEILKVIGSNENETLNEGTISKYGSAEETFYTLILRNIEERLKAENKISLLTKQTEYLEEEIKELTSSYGIIAEHDNMTRVLTLIDQVAKTDATVLITGETGTGKELVSRAIHSASQRSDKPLIKINCGAMPSNLIESELFGHKKGAFTGATQDRKGRFLLADKGTLFLDEIGELPLELQPKLLRVIQEGEFDPVGSSETLKVDVRIIAATHKNLKEHANNGDFREDLYYRLNVFPIHVPALRERGDDVHLIAQEMMMQLAAKMNKPNTILSETDKMFFSSYDWPGNVRELQNLIERAIIVSQNGSINWNTIIPRGENIKKAEPDSLNERILTSGELIEFERENILRALRLTKWKISGINGAAELLQLKPTTLASKIKALGIERPI